MIEGGEQMKKLTFQKSRNIKNKSKIIMISSHHEDEESVTDVRKSFCYMLSRADFADDQAQPPEMYVKKNVDARSGMEHCHFKVKGSFFITYQRQRLKVRFHHSLHIRVAWKKKVFSPKKSEVLT
jgi:hypothetical protein